MKILLFTLEFPPFKGGVANYYENLVKKWPKSDQILVLENNQNNLIKKWIWPKWLPAIYYLYKKITNEKVDHIFVGHILPLGTAAYLVTRKTKTPYSVFLHGMDLTYAQRTKIKKEITKKILENAKFIICGNNYTAKLVKDFIGDSGKIKVVNPGVDIVAEFDSRHVQHTRNSYGLKDKKIIFSMGRLVKRKGFDKVIEIMPKLLKKNSNIYYVIAGSGPDEDYLKNLAKGVKNIIFLGKIDEKHKWTWLNACDIFIMPSRDINGDFEGFGIVFLEAALANKPVIAGRSGGTEDAVKNAITGLLVDPLDARKIENAIMYLINDENLRNKLGSQGKERALKEFNWEKQVKKIHEIINN